MNKDQFAALKRILEITAYIYEDNAATDADDAAVMKDISLLRAWAKSQRG
jgi:hypothetical protein